MKTLQGKLTISRYLNSDTVGLEVVDDVSGTIVLRGTMPIADFAKALLGLGRVEFTYELWCEYAGLARENKTERVEVSEFRPKAPEIARLVVALEHDGWMVEDKDFENHHLYVGEGEKHFYDIRCVRYVHEAR